MRTSLAVAALAATAWALPSVAGQADEPWIDPGYRGEFIRAGGGFSCKVGADQKVRPEHGPYLTEQACLHMGPFAIGGDSALVKALGKPEQVAPLSAEATQLVFLPPTPTGNTYMVVTIAHGRIVALQMSGEAPIPGWSFNHIDLGMPVEKLTGILGEAFNVRPVADNGSELWTYGAWTFSFEVKAGRVISVRIADHDYS